MDNVTPDLQSLIGRLVSRNMGRYATTLVTMPYRLCLAERPFDGPNVHRASGRSYC